ncbi:CoA-transferase subunit beta [Chloroflexota bacterium]
MMQEDKAEEYTAADQMIVSAARFVGDTDVVFVGVGLPMVAGLLAKYTHAPSCTIMTENGIIRATRFPSALGTDGLRLQTMSDKLTGLYYVMCLGQAGFVGAGFLGAGQIDRYGNSNDTVVGDYRNPIHRWPGSGGGNDVMSFCDKTVIMLRQSKRRFLEKVDFNTCPGYLDGKPGRREELGLRPNTGPVAVITDMAMFTFEDREMTVKSVHGDIGVTLDQVKAEVSWDIKVSADLADTVPPTKEELRALREEVDPEKRWVDGRRAAVAPPPTPPK